MDVKKIIVVDDDKVCIKTQSDKINYSYLLYGWVCWMPTETCLLCLSLPSLFRIGTLFMFANYYKNRQIWDMILSEVSVTSCFLNSQTTPHPPVSLPFTVMRRINSITGKYLQRGYCSIPVNRIAWTD
jgi:hypothetical protein